MPKYTYTAINLENKKAKGAVEARDYDDFRKLMRAQNVVLVKYAVVEEKGLVYRMKANEASDFSRQLGSMLGSGITVIRALEILKGRDAKPQLLSIYEKLHKDVQQGLTLSEAMRLQERSFPQLLINMYASGETSGQLEQVANKMAVHYEKEHRLNGKVKTATTYPAILFTVTVIVVMLIFTVVLPQFFQILEGIELPLITRVMIAISTFLQKYWYAVIIGILILIFIYRRLHDIEKVALRMDRFKLRLAVVGKLLRTIYTARFARTLSSLYSSGISMITALEVSSTIVGNKFIEKQFSEVIKDVRNGEPLSAAVEKVDGFDGKLSATILIGEESGRLDSMLVSTAESFDYEAEVATGRLVQLIEPVMIVFLAVVIGSIMLSVMLPIMTLYQNVGNL